MRFIPTSVHGVLDYLMGAILIAAPWLLGFADVEAAMSVAVAIGMAVIVYSFFTDYELGVMRSIPMPAHLTLDAVGGIVLAASPWIFGFSETVWIPHVVFGVAEFCAAMTTEMVPRHGGLTMGGPRSI